MLIALSGLLVSARTFYFYAFSIYDESKDTLIVVVPASVKLAQQMY